MRIEEIHPWQLPRVWHILKPVIDKALEHSLGERTASDMLEDFMNDNLWLLTGIDEQGDLAGVLVAEEIVHPQKKELYVHAWATVTGYGFDDWVDLFEQYILNIAYETGCHYVSSMCRKGLAKKMSTKRGWIDTHSVISKLIPME
tara:strand:- start:118 stop:552 length:435 start_codon:yes stop_codon:yes gene_type:complete